MHKRLIGTTALVVALATLALTAANVARAAPSLVSLTLTPTTIAPLGCSTGTVTLSEPAASDTTIALSSAPTSVSMPASVVVAAGQTRAQFAINDVASAPDTVISATLGGTTLQAHLGVSSAPTHLVINEVDYDNVGVDTAEFVEIYNPSTSAIDLSNLALVLVNGMTNSESKRIALGTDSLAAGQYLVVADPGLAVATGAKVISFSTPQDNIGNGTNGLAIVDTNSKTVVDALSYEGPITAANIIGFPTPVSLVEGTALSSSVADSNTTQGSLNREPNGSDTDDAATDWAFKSAPTPGAANSSSALLTASSACTTPNHAPVLAPIGNKSVTTGQHLGFTISGSDADGGDTLAYSASNLPSGATFNSATRVFSWTPNTGQAGVYPNVHFAVSDGDLSDSEDITISVGAPASSPPPAAPPPAPPPPSPPPASPPPPLPGAPNTRLTKHPATRVVTKTARATVRFGFAATPVGARFKCKLDRGPYGICVSPKTYIVKVGKHVFTVDAISGGIADPTPATLRFTVARKRHR
jgi:Putative Ig domain/Lamin Tail Domain